MERFLRLAVEHTLEGKADELKEYLIGVDVFDRPPLYDPRVDPIVRVEARRLRQKLKAYYEGDGRADAIAIEFTAGSYAPRIGARGNAPIPAAAPEPAINTIAVLPLANLSAGKESEYFSDGLTEELIHALTKGMRVVAWNSAEQLRGRQQDLAAIRQQLNVGTALTGSVRMAGPELRVRAQLIDTESGVYLWSETFDRRVEDVFAIEEEIARAIVRTLRVRLTGGREDAPVGRGRSTISSYDWYLKGRHHWRRRTPEDLKRSVGCFESAVDADESSALAHSGLADAYTLLVDYGLMSPADGMPKAKAAASRAIALDPQLGEAHASLALIRGLYDWEWEDAELLYQSAIALNPGYATVHQWLAVDHYAMLGRFDEARVEVDLSLQLDPLSGILREGRAYLLMLERRYEEAALRLRELIGDDPSFYKAYTSLGRVYAQTGQYREALAMLQKGRSLAGDVPNILAAMGQVHGLAGDAPRARGLLAELEAMAKRIYVPSTCFAVVHLGLQDHGRALEWLETGCRQRDLPLAGLKVHPLYDPLRAEPRFQALLGRLRFA
ncbi:MAG: tetratricopeptide repeat protein [Acidobacteriia bacterium]|nr:tetratricopeptide repeat protein [Terriglobia bacterium]